MDRIKGRTTQYLRDRVIQVKCRGQSPGLNLRRSARRRHFNRLSHDIAQPIATAAVAEVLQIHKDLSTRGARISIRLRLFTKESGFHIT